MSIAQNNETGLPEFLVKSPQFDTRSINERTPVWVKPNGASGYYALIKRTDPLKLVVVCLNAKSSYNSDPDEYVEEKCIEVSDVAAGRIKLQFLKGE